MFVDSFNEIVRSQYSRLYNNLFLCKTDSTDHGYIIEDKNTYNDYGKSGSGGVHMLIRHPQQWECQALIMGYGM